MNDQPININMPVLKNQNAKLMKNKLRNVMYYGIMLSRYIIENMENKVTLCVDIHMQYRSRL